MSSGHRNHRSVRHAAIAAILTLSMLGFGSAHAAIEHSEDFESPPLGPEWTGAGSLQSTQGLSAFGFGDTHLKNDGTLASLLGLSGLAPHSSMTLSFDLAMWDSIDLNADIFQVGVDGGFVINQTFGNYFPPSGCEGPGTALTPPTSGVFTDPQLGYNTAFRDCGRAVSITFAHSASTANISFQYPNSQGAPDEAFGIDNVVVETNAVAAVPGPISLVLVGLGLAGLAATRRRGRA